MPEFKTSRIDTLPAVPGVPSRASGWLGTASRGLQVGALPGRRQRARERAREPRGEPPERAGKHQVCRARTMGAEDPTEAERGP